MATFCHCRWLPEMSTISDRTRGVKPRLRWCWREFRIQSLSCTTRNIYHRQHAYAIWPDCHYWKSCFTGRYIGSRPHCSCRPWEPRFRRRGRLLGLPPSPKSPSQCWCRIFDFDGPIIQFSNSQISKAILGLPASGYCSALANTTVFNVVCN